MTKLDLTAGGRLEVHPFVTARKVEQMSNLISDGLAGGFTGEHGRTRLKETLATSDAVFSLAHLINIRNLPKYDEAENQWSKIAAIETVDDFKPATFYSLTPNFDNLKFGKGNKGQPGINPKVAEGDTYQYAYGYTEESLKAAIEKRGSKWGVTLEDIINDPTRKIRQIPGDMLQIALDTDEFLVFDALVSQAVSGSQLQAGTDPVSGSAVAANADFSAAALRVAFSQMAQKKIAGRSVPLATGYYVVVALGQGAFVEAELERARTIIQITNGNVIYGKPSDAGLGRVRGVIESEFITDTDSWYVVPEAGSTRRPSLVKLQLAGYTAPEVFVGNFAGAHVGGAVQGTDFARFAGFDNDTVDLKNRQFTNAALVTQDQMIWSTGT